MSFVCLLLLFFAGLLGSFEEKRGDAIAGAKNALAVIVGLNLVIYVILLGVFGRKALGVMEYPVLVLMSMVKLPGGFLKRQDAFMVAIWFFTLYALINSSLFYGNEILKNLIEKKENGKKKNEKKENAKKGSKRYILVTLLLVFAMAKVWYDNQWQVGEYLIYFVIAATCLVLVIPLIVYLMHSAYQRRSGHGQKN